VESSNPTQNPLQMSHKISDEKLEYGERMNRLMDTYAKVLFCNIDNVQSQQLHDIRAALRGKGEMLVGKKTLQKKIVKLRAEAESATATDKAFKEKLCDDNLLVGNLALVFTNEEVGKVQEVLQKYRVQAPARVGAVAPCDVTISAGNTGLEPTMTNFFQALNIATKISKGTVEIVSDKKVLNQGEKVDNSTAVLLQKLNISPFFYQAEIKFFWERGLMFTAEDMSINDAFLNNALSTGIANLTAVSLATGILTEASLPFAVMDGFKNLLAASVESDYEFTEFNGKKLRDDIKSGKAVGPKKEDAKPAPKEDAKPAPKKVEKAPEPEDDDDVGLGGLF